MPLLKPLPLLAPLHLLPLLRAARCLRRVQLRRVHRLLRLDELDLELGQLLILPLNQLISLYLLTLHL